MNRQTGEFQVYYSKSSGLRWHTIALNKIRVLIALITATVLTVWSLLCVFYNLGPEHILVVVVGSTLFIAFFTIALFEGEFYKKVPVEPKSLLDSSVNPYFVMYIPMRGRRGETYFYIEDKDNAYVLDVLDCDFFKWRLMSTGKRYLVANDSIKMIDYEFCSKTSSEIAEIIVDKHPVFMNNSINSVGKRNKLYKAMMTEICS